MEKEEFKQIRKKLGRTQFELGKQLDVSAKTISRYENGLCAIPWYVEERMRGSDIRDKRRIVHSEGMVPLELIINSYDAIKTVYMEGSHGPMTVIVTAEITEGKVWVTNYMQGQYPDQIGRYIKDGCYTPFEGRVLTDNMIYQHLEYAFLEVKYMEIQGLGFNYKIEKPD